MGTGEFIKKIKPTLRNESTRKRNNFSKEDMVRYMSSGSQGIQDKLRREIVDKNFVIK